MQVYVSTFFQFFLFTVFDFQTFRSLTDCTFFASMMHFPVLMPFDLILRYHCGCGQRCHDCPRPKHKLTQYLMLFSPIFYPQLIRFLPLLTVVVILQTVVRGNYRISRSKKLLFSKPKMHAFLSKYLASIVFGWFFGLIVSYLTKYGPLNSQSFPKYFSVFSNIVLLPIYLLRLLFVPMNWLIKFKFLQPFLVETIKIWGIFSFILQLLLGFAITVLVILFNAKFNEIQIFQQKVWLRLSDWLSMLTQIFTKFNKINRTLFQ